MIVYKCDGESFGGRKCSNESTRDFPERWLTISGSIKNGLHDAHYLQANGTYHFCSRECFENFFFKNVNVAGKTTGNIHMNSTIDPGTKQEEVKEDQAAIAAAEDQANVGTELPATETTEQEQATIPDWDS